MKVRGAPLIGVTVAFGVYFAYKESNNKNDFERNINKIKNTRPTAINLFWSVDKMLSVIDSHKSKIENKNNLLKAAKNLIKQDENSCKKIGEYGLKILEKYHAKKKEINVLTHCNAGWLATIDWGTATAPIYYANKKKYNIHVWVDETRPRNQGANLTSYEL